MKVSVYAAQIKYATKDKVEKCKLAFYTAIPGKRATISGDPFLGRREKKERRFNRDEQAFRAKCPWIEILDIEMTDSDDAHQAYQWIAKRGITNFNNQREMYKQKSKYHHRHMICTTTKYPYITTNEFVRSTYTHSARSKTKTNTKC